MKIYGNSLEIRGNLNKLYQIQTETYTCCNPHLCISPFCVSLCKLSSTVSPSAGIGFSPIGRLECDIIPMFESQLPRKMELAHRWSQGRSFKEFISCSFQKHKPLECMKNKQKTHRTLVKMWVAHVKDSGIRRGRVGFSFGRSFVSFFFFLTSTTQRVKEFSVDLSAGLYPKSEVRWALPDGWKE